MLYISLSVEKHDYLQYTLNYNNILANPLNVIYYGCKNDDKSLRFMTGNTYIFINF